MLPSEILEAVRRLELTARRAVDEHLAGRYHSLFKGRGMDFQDVRAYQPGDDIRVIDWNVSARMNELHVKQFVEERELTVFVLVDVSASHLFGTRNRLKRQTAAQLAALIALTAVQNGDRVGLLLFTDRVETCIPPRKGRKHVLRLIREVLDPDVDGRTTSVSSALEYLVNISPRRCLAFVISDFLDDDFDQSFKIAHRRHELIPLIIRDPMERRMPKMGLVHFEDPETGEMIGVDTSSPRVRDAYAATVEKLGDKRDRLFRKLAVDSLFIDTGGDHIEPVIRYFRERAQQS